MKEFPTPIIVISKCLGFAACRWNAVMIPEAFITKLKPYVTFKPICPECEIGLDVPREPIRIIKHGDQLKLVQPATDSEITNQMLSFMREFLSRLGPADGFILKSKSPSCGIRDAKFYSGPDDTAAIGKAGGIFGSEVSRQFSDIAIEDERRLTNFKIREHFLTRIFALARWRQVEQNKSMADLTGFHAAHKLLLMSYSQVKLRRLGRIVANLEKRKISEVFAQYKIYFRSAFLRAPKCTSNINVMMHALGYFSDMLMKREKSHFLEALEKYREGRIPLGVPVQILQSWIARFGQEYLAQQTFFQPYPPELAEITDFGQGAVRRCES